MGAGVTFTRWLSHVAMTPRDPCSINALSSPGDTVEAIDRETIRTAAVPADKRQEIGNLIPQTTQSLRRDTRRLHPGSSFRHPGAHLPAVPAGFSGVSQPPAVRDSIIRASSASAPYGARLRRASRYILAAFGSFHCSGYRRARRRSAVSHSGAGGSTFSRSGCHLPSGDTRRKTVAAAILAFAVRSALPRSAGSDEATSCSRGRHFCQRRGTSPVTKEP